VQVGDLVRVRDGYRAIGIIARVHRSNFNEFNLYDVVLIGSECMRTGYRDCDLEVMK
jgi:hypothetical protein